MSAAIRPPGEVGAGIARTTAGVCEQLPDDVNVWAILAVAAAALFVACAIGWARETFHVAAERRRVARLERSNASLRRDRDWWRSQAKTYAVEVADLRAAGSQP